MSTAADPNEAEQLLPLVYSELRRLAAAKLAHEKPGQTLNATALVHEAYLRMVGECPNAGAGGIFANRRHFFAAAAEAMRRILIENARRKSRERHGGKRERIDIDPDRIATDPSNTDILAVNDALDELSRRDPLVAELVKLHYFAGLKLEEAGELLGLSPRTAYRHWAFARAWLFRQLGAEC